LSGTEIPAHSSTQSPSADPTTTATEIPHSPFPTTLTPNPTLTAGWQELEEALAQNLMASHLNRGPVFCEWAYLGEEFPEVYLYVICRSTVPLQEGDTHLPGVSIPAVVIYDQGEIQGVQIPGAGSLYARDIRELFPPEVQKTIFQDQIDYQALSDHLLRRLDHPDEPPLVVPSG
jgi:hypothetical protein